MNFNLTFRNLDARRVAMTKGHVNINNNSTITAVAENNGRLTVSFAFSCNYEPNIGLVRIEGDLTIDDTRENIDEAVNQWNNSEKKKLPKKMAEKVHNTILSNCIIEASLLARDVKLPAPIPLPQVNMEKEGDTDTSYIR